MLKVITEFFSAAQQQALPFVFIRPKPIREPDIYQGDFDLLVNPEALNDLLRLFHRICSANAINFRIERVKYEKTTVTLFAHSLEHCVEFDIWTELDIKDRLLPKGTHIPWYKLAEQQQIIEKEGHFTLSDNIAALFYLSHMHSKHKKLESEEVQYRLNYYRQLPNLDSEVKYLFDDVSEEKMRLANKQLQDRGLFAQQSQHRLAQVFYRLKKKLAKSSRVIAVVGPDGVGKTTVIKQLTKRYRAKYYMYKKTFRRSFLYLFLRKLTWNKIDLQYGPLDKNQYDDIQHIKLFWISLVSGYCKAFLCRFGKTTIFDRFYIDLLITGSRSMETPLTMYPTSRELIKKAPTPSCIVQLDAPEATILGRKEELSVQHIQQFREMYFELSIASNTPTYVYINTYHSLEKTFEFIDKLDLKL
ncbi:hypothetical protein F9817_21345 [Vibrio sp. CAIM 722]|uniref:Thymidylate kinase-like domain-containing protein n=1 Tax=Vibrio eleionomae TaxID=2653505 RepID=A0A7X4LPJ5_9VIBR|nr:hypothetical protein [Vibrio eleionomae]MZI95732.1 hypothetical protein [Vibrio eleionomae]